MAGIATCDALQGDQSILKTGDFTESMVIQVNDPKIFSFVYFKISRD